MLGSLGISASKAYVFRSSVEDSRRMNTESMMKRSSWNSDCLTCLTFKIQIVSKRLGPERMRERLDLWHDAGSFDEGDAGRVMPRG